MSLRHFSPQPKSKEKKSKSKIFIYRICYKTKIDVSSLENLLQKKKKKAKKEILENV